MPLYLDHAATTPLRAEALEAMLPYLGAEFGNPSSPHAWGRRARGALDEAHERIAAGLGCGPREIVITSGGTEALNLALKGAAWAGKARGHRILTTRVEHHAVLHPLQHLEKFGFEVVELPVDRYGRVDPADVEAALTDRTILVAIGYANNEVGTVQPVAEIVRRVRAGGPKGCLVAVDAVAAAPYLRVDVGDLGADLVAIAGHKLEGPKGVGALYVRAGTHILGQQHGGTQERHRRAGTEDVAGAVGMGVVVELDLEGVAASVGSACTTGSAEPSHVLTAMGYPEEEARGSLRFSMGRSTTDADVDEALSVVPRLVAEARAAAVALPAERASIA